MPRLAIVSDTHIPTRASGIPDWIEREIRSADAVVHAGDFTSEDAYDRVLDLAEGELTAVSGNMDPAGLSLPETATLELAGQTFVLTHGTGPPQGYEERVRQQVRATTDDENPIAIAGHTHSVLDSTDGIRLLNPGSATGAAPASETSMMVATVTEAGIEVEVRRE